MKRIGLLSDTHNYIDTSIIKHLQDCDEIWHAGDFGTIAIAEEISKQTGVLLRGVYGNIDGYDIRSVYPEKLMFSCEEVTVFMQHIGGYPGRYAPNVKQQLIKNNVRLFISGHSHILKIIFDDALQCLHINPGAAGKQGWHQVRTLVKFSIEKATLKDCRVIELGTRKN